MVRRKEEFILTAFGQTKPVSEWAREYKIDYEVLWQRIKRYKWKGEKALSTPVKHSEKMCEEEWVCPPGEFGKDLL